MKYIYQNAQNLADAVMDLEEERLKAQRVTKASSRKKTIYEVLKEKLQREPTHKELCDEVRRILTEVLK